MSADRPRPKSFHGPLLAGLKEYAVQAPFDLMEPWGMPAIPLWNMRLGRRVQGTDQGLVPSSAVVPRSWSFWQLGCEAFTQPAELNEGEVLDVPRRHGVMDTSTR